MANNGHTPIQMAMLEILSDGKWHCREELHACLLDDLGPVSNIHAHLTAIRKIIHHRGLDVVCRVHKGERGYTLVRVLASPYDGKR